MTYTLGGRKVSREQFFKGLEGQVRQVAVDQVRKRVERVRCPEHGKSVAVVAKQGASQLEFGLTGCCERAIKMAQDALK